MRLPTRVYVASSWRCEMQQAVVMTLRANGIDCYDFRNPAPGQGGFAWRQVMPNYRQTPEGKEGMVKAEEYLAALENPIAIAGFEADFGAMVECDACVLVLPCNRSAHLELGWFCGVAWAWRLWGKANELGPRTAILLDGPFVLPELMYKLVDHISPDLLDLLAWLGVEDEEPSRPLVATGDQSADS